MIATSTLSSKYQTTIPKKIVEKLGMEPSDTILYQEEGPYVIIRPQRKITAQEALARFPRKETTRVVSLEEMEEAIKKGATRGWDRH